MPIQLHATRKAANLVSNLDGLGKLLGFPVVRLNAVIECPSRHYSSFDVPKKNGGVRTIEPPHRPLREIQRSLLNRLYRRIKIPKHIHGGVPRRSIFTFARPHVGKSMVATLDIKDFFPSVGPSHLEPVFFQLGFRGEALNAVVSLTMLRDCLPQGAPTSCLLANLSFSNADASFNAVCRKRNLLYGRFVDDIAISGNVDFGELRGTFLGIIEAKDFQAAEDKIHFYAQSQRQIVTGLVLNEKLRPTREYVASLKQRIHNCRTFGPTFIANSDGLTVRKLKNSLTSSARFVGQSDPKLGKKLRGLLCSVAWGASTNRFSD
ncbi:Reverse transcriptase (RNA-dependent DNA polymerase) [Symmachiella dynata]|uniref:reverse transcriptase family protein n=1 Tax=Symmachiella dynata TaxID=2527995 RepID=UPI00118BFF60|nr:reverse transcriptase family protein [Symmachiella dynata]QDT51892.1 Reverse transcriptase (RNA-dependent DNA polymerase) [Symmachiella dynata]